MMPWVMLSAVVLFAICLVVIVADLRHGIIPDACNVALALLGISVSAMSGRDLLVERLIDGVIVLALFVLVRIAYRRWRGRSGIGLGDVKFLAASAVLVGLDGVQILLLVACLSGLATVGLRRMAGGTVTPVTRIRFGPHLVLGLLVAMAGPLVSADHDEGWPAGGKSVENRAQMGAGLSFPELSTEANGATSSRGDGLAHLRKRGAFPSVTATMALRANVARPLIAASTTMPNVERRLGVCQRSTRPCAAESILAATGPPDATSIAARPL